MLFLLLRFGNSPLDLTADATLVDTFAEQLAASLSDPEDARPSDPCHPYPILVSY